MAAEPRSIRKIFRGSPRPNRTRLCPDFSIKPGFRIDLVAAEPLVMIPSPWRSMKMAVFLLSRCAIIPNGRDEHSGASGSWRTRMAMGCSISRLSTWTISPGQLLSFAMLEGSSSERPRYFILQRHGWRWRRGYKEDCIHGIWQGHRPLNVQQLFNSFNWGLDNRIHGASGGNGGSVVSTGASSASSRSNCGVVILPLIRAP